MKILIPFAFLVCSTNAISTSLEVLHWWTAPGEIEAQKVFQEALAEQNVHWKNFAIIGAGGGSALRVLQMRALSGNPPDVAQIKGPDIGEWAKMGMLKNIDNIIPKQLWDKHLYDVVKQTVLFEDQYMALPLNIHRVNWLWLNKTIFDELQLAAPQTWPEFFTTADKIQKAGYIAIAHGGTSWQDSLLFESVALSILGADKYKKAFVEFDTSILTSKAMHDAFKIFKKLNQYISKDMRGEEWSVASRMMSDNQAAMQFMGDWAKGMWLAEGKQAMKDFICADVPESENLFSYNIDSFVLFKQFNESPTRMNKKTLAKTLLSSEFQTAFNKLKGSIPVRNDMKVDSFDLCAQKSYFDFNNASLVPSFSQNMATTSHLQSEVSKVISHYFNTDQMSAEQVVNQLSQTIRAVNK